MGFNYITRTSECDCCSANLSFKEDFTVDNPDNTDGYDEYCKECYTELDGKCWSGDWDSEGNRITIETNIS